MKMIARMEIIMSEGTKQACILEPVVIDRLCLSVKPYPVAE